MKAESKIIACDINHSFTQIQIYSLRESAKIHFRHFKANIQSQSVDPTKLPTLGIKASSNILTITDKINKK